MEDAVNLSDITVNVDCNIANIKLDLDKLTQLHVGDVLDVNVNTKTSLVNLCINNNCFAQGYLVDINGMLGIKIIKKMLV